jgi:hypothetical protein
LIGTSKSGHDPDYRAEKDVGTFHPDRIDAFYSHITKGRKTFVYEFYSEPTFFRRHEKILTPVEVETILNE